MCPCAAERVSSRRLPDAGSVSRPGTTPRCARRRLGPGGWLTLLGLAATAVQAAGDLTVQQVRVTSAHPRVGQAVGVRAEVRNAGTSASEAAWLDGWWNRPGTTPTGTAGETWGYIPPLAAGASRTVTLSFVPPAPGRGVVRVFADAAGGVAEASEANNQATQAVVTVADASLYLETAAGAVDRWTLDGEGRRNGAVHAADVGSWTLRAACDFDGDGLSDLTWQNTTSATEWQQAIWLLARDRSLSRVVSLPKVAAGWSLCGAGDIDRDGIADLFWQNAAGTAAVWLMRADGTLRQSSSYGTFASWRLCCVADFDGDGRVDLCWQNATGSIGIWLMQDATTMRTSIAPPAAGTGWLVRAAPDTDGDGRADLMFQKTSGELAGWLINPDGSLRHSFLLPTASGWTLRAFGF